MTRGRRACTGPSTLAHRQCRTGVTLSACAPLPRASSRRHPSSCRPACLRRAWHLYRVAPPLAPAGVAAGVGVQQQARAVRAAWRQGLARTSPAALAPVQPAPAARLAAGRPLARPFRVAPSCRVSLAAPQRVRAVQPAAARPEPALRAAGLSVALPRALRAVRPSHAARIVHVVPAVAPSVPGARSAAARPEPALRVAAVLAAWLRALRAVRPSHAAPIFHVVPAVAPSVRAG